MTVQPTRDQIRALADIDREWIRELADKAHIEGFFLHDWEVPELLADVTKLLDQLDQAEARIKVVEDVLDTAILRDGTEEQELARRIRRAMEGCGHERRRAQ